MVYDCTIGIQARFAALPTLHSHACLPAGISDHLEIAAHDVPQALMPFFSSPTMQASVFYQWSTGAKHSVRETRPRT
jgi:hypothetical protein